MLRILASRTDCTRSIVVSKLHVSWRKFFTALNNKYNHAHLDDALSRGNQIGSSTFVVEASGCRVLQSLRSQFVAACGADEVVV